LYFSRCPFVTICTQNRECLFGEITNGEMQLNPMGEIAQAEWIKTGQMRPNIQLHESIIMPNHIHGIIQITHPDPVGARCTRPLPHASTTPTPQPIANIRPTDENTIAHHTGADRVSTDTGVADMNAIDDMDAIADHVGLGRVARAFFPLHPLNATYAYTQTIPIHINLGTLLQKAIKS
jgi:REP element-mobilizing transposase RayT